MNNSSSSSRYHTLSIALHWLMFLLVAAVYAFIEFRVLFDKGSEPRETMKALHFMFGMSVFFLVWLRLLARFIYARPQISPAPHIAQQWAAKVVHWLLYAFLIGMPLAGWLILSAKGRTVPFFGLELPALIGPDKALSGEIQDWHAIVGEIGYYVIGLHALAALFHHYVLRNNTLRRMLPWRAGA